MISLRQATAEDAPVLWATTRALAENHGHLADFTATVVDYAAALADPRGLVGGVIATWDGTAAGTAVWHRSFSTFSGREVMYLEDLSVLPEFRRRGIARALMAHVAGIAQQQGMARILWHVMDWNVGGKALYASLGAVEDPDLRVMTLTGAALEALAP
jgi:GNAT superfamily N-acetyltransferase